MPNVETWEDRTRGPLIGLSALFLVAWAWPIIDPGLATGVVRMCHVIAIGIWCIYVIEFVLRLVITRAGWDYVGNHWPEVGLILIPVFRPLQLLQYLVVRRWERDRASSRVRLLTAYVVALAIASLLIGSLAVLQAERGEPGATIDSFGDALWWTATTVTTVGYGDEYPVTVRGRFVAVGLMMIGIALVSTISARLAASFITQLNNRIKE